MRIDPYLDLEKAWLHEHKSKVVTDAVHRDFPETRPMRIPFRAKISGFGRVPDGLSVVGDTDEI